MFDFKITRKDKKSQARVGELKTPHSKIKTPAFVPVATQGSVKTLSPDDLKSLGVQVVLANTYHLFLRPGPDLIKRLGGLHQFSGWQGPWMTDSGGFQVFSLGAGLEDGIGKVINFFPKRKAKPSRLIKPSQVKISQRGVLFSSHLDGKKYLLTPELSVRIQEQLGADIIFAFDECTSPLASYQYTKESLERTHQWAERCLLAKKRKDQALFGIVQGGRFKDLRQKSARFISNLPFFGFGIGGSLGRTKKEMGKVLEWVASILPEEKPRHLLGIGQPEDILLGVEKGMDLFDCVFPTRLARHGVLLGKTGKINVWSAKYRKDSGRPVKDCFCWTCTNFGRAYLHHLFRTGEVLAARLATFHNLFFMVKFMEEIREAILKKKFSEYKKNFLKKYKPL